MIVLGKHQKYLSHKSAPSRPYISDFAYVRLDMNKGGEQRADDRLMKLKVRFAKTHGHCIEWLLVEFVLIKNLSS